MFKRAIFTGVWMAVALSVATPASAQLGGALNRLKQAKDAYDDYNVTDQEEHTLGQEISAKLRDKYGVVQDSAVHKYVTLVGKVLSNASDRPSLSWTFIVLDTDGVNAFAAPGGFVHITKGALALIDNEAELADVLGHEIGHITKKHTINAIKKQKLSGTFTDRAGFLKAFADAAYSALLENNFDRSEENAADEVAVTLANGAGYAPQGLAGFLTRLADRNKDLKERSGPFASHPETQARLNTLNRLIGSRKLTATATVAARFNASITYEPVPVGSLALGAAPSAGSSSSGGSQRGGIAALNPVGRERSNNQTVSSAGSRGLNPDRDARGGPNKGAVNVTVTGAEIAAFRKGIAG